MKEITGFTPLIERLKERYKPSVIPPCRVCGEKLSIQSCGGGKPTVWGCGMWKDDPDKPGEYRKKEGRTCADDHYAKSIFEDLRRGGDGDVMELIAQHDALYAALEKALPLIREEARMPWKTTPGEAEEWLRGAESALSKARGEG